MKKIMPFLSFRFSVPLLALALSACGGGPRPIHEPPPWPETHARAAPQPEPKPPPLTHAVVAVPSSAPQGPLTVAKVESYMDALESDLRHHVHGEGIVVARQGNAINIVIPNSQIFSDDGGVSGDDVLEPLGAILKNYGHVAVAVGGYTDTAGTPDKNLAVSEKRARLIADALAHEGVAAQRISAQGFGQTHLRFSTGDNKKEPRNRRIEILLKARPG